MEEKKYPIGIEPNTSKHQDIILKVCKAHGIKSLELTTKHIALMSDCISEYIAQQPAESHIRKESVEEQWESFWKPIITNEDGTINIEQIKKELYDFSFIMEQVPKVYCHITGHRMSKVMYPADTVITVADDYFNEQLEEAVKEERGERPAAGREELSDEIKQVIAAFVKVACHIRNYPHPQLTIELLRSEAVIAETQGESLLGVEVYNEISELAFKQQKEK